MGRFDGEAKAPRIALRHRWVMLRVFQRDVDEETRIGRGKFLFTGCHIERDGFSRGMWMSAIEEEVGKLCRASNKLSIVIDTSQREGYLDEGYHRILTASSLLRRLAENWEDLPDK
jgi:hypothetical protein